MTKIELTISPDYVPTWTITDAIRELFQNAIDQQTQHPDNTMSWDYDRDSHTMTIANKSSELTAKSLLLGSTTKVNDKNTIGQFGEGYKIATLVLLRNGKTITFYNRAVNEIWRPRFVESRKFGTKILTFFIEHDAVMPWSKKTNDDNLIIKIFDITEDEFNNEIFPSNLYMINNPNNILEHTCFGDILTEEMSGKVFVNGLFVCKYEPYKYGYNFMPQYIKLDRDRKMASDFDLKWMASKMWAVSSNRDMTLQLIGDGAADVGYIEHMGNNNIADALFLRFIAKYGSNAIPVSTQDELEKLPSRYRGIIVSEQSKLMIVNASGYVEPQYDDKSPIDELRDWFDSISDNLSEEDISEFENIYNKLVNME